jgi:hypothetical protein
MAAEITRRGSLDQPSGEFGSVRTIEALNGGNTTRGPAPPAGQG